MVGEFQEGGAKALGIKAVKKSTEIRCEKKHCSPVVSCVSNLFPQQIGKPLKVKCYIQHT